MVDLLHRHHTSHRVCEITTAEQLRQALGGPSVSGGVNTIRTRLDPIDAEWLAGCGLWFMATGTGNSADCSPRGDEPGAVRVLDERHLVLPERAGNRRGDGYANLLRNPGIGLLFVIPGRTDTLRVNGRATMVSDAPWFDELTVGGARPPLAIVVEIKEVFYHCVKAFRRTRLWEPESWTPEAAPSRQAVAAALGGAVE